MTLAHLINEAVCRQLVTPDQFDALLDAGWRHFGTNFFRYNFALHQNTLCRVLPLRVRVADFRPTKSQRRALKRNADLTLTTQPTRLDAAKYELFERHKTRFTENIPDSLHDFLSHEPDTVPCDNLEFAIHDGDRLLAVSFLDVGRRSMSSVYAMFDPAVADRSLGILTALYELQFAAQNDREYYYLGYAYHIPSHYDYKERFGALEAYDWHGRWLPFEG